MHAARQFPERDTAPLSEARQQLTTDAVPAAVPNLLYECGAFRIDLAYAFPRFHEKRDLDTRIEWIQLYRYPDGTSRRLPGDTSCFKQKQTVSLKNVYACALIGCVICTFITEKAALQMDLQRVNGWCTMQIYLRCSLEKNLEEGCLFALQIILHDLPDAPQFPDRDGHYSFQMLPNESLSPRSPTLLASLRGPQCDTHRLRSWLEHCCTSHTECSDDQEERTDPSQKIRLIDTERRCISPLFHGNQIPRFVALSYVWGKSPKHLALTSANEEALKEEGSLQDISATLADTIELLRIMGQRWLWIDSLCIMQDDEEELGFFIPAMQNIYRGALFTVVAAAGTDADAGLPGVMKNREIPTVIPLGDVSLVSMRHYLDGTNFRYGTLDASFWKTRGWTFQEEMLSRRLLIFLEDQVIWQCSQASWLEEVDLDGTSLILSWGPPNFEKPELTVDNFYIFIDQYTRRNLTLDSDILRAFSGILAAIPGEYLHATPKLRFVEYLLWETGGNEPLRRRNFPRLPTWSWLGWKGPICVDRPSTPLVSCYHIEGSELRQLNAPPNSETTSVTLADIPAAIPMDENHIMFWAEVTLIKVERDGMQWMVSTPDGEGVGEMHPDVRSTMERQDMHEFVVIARSWRSYHGLMVSWEGKIATRYGMGRLNEDYWSQLRKERKLIVLG